MAEVKSDGEARGNRRETSAADDAIVFAPRFDEREEATARPVVPLGGSNNAATRGAGGFSLRANSRHLLLAWAVLATLAAGGIAIYRGAQTPGPQVAPQTAPESTASGEVAATPEPARRKIPVAPARAAKITEARATSPTWEAPDWSDRENVKREELDEEELDEEELEERARKEEKRRRKEEKKRREEAEEEAERARKELRKKAERQRERQKDAGRKAQLLGVLTGQD
jgi:hypothetical protein